QEIQMPSEQIFPFGAEGKGGTPPLPRRKREKMAEGIEYPMNKPIIQVGRWHLSPERLKVLEKQPQLL
ncbi:MAG TPA: hypothetical protein VLE95_06360, partial [Chlamydiales bacterium]|nr:hypothetical protein [Chlamydiales bacterium]